MAITRSDLLQELLPGLTSDVDITDEESKEIADHYTKALAESMASTKIALEKSLFVDVLGGKPSWEIEVKFDE
jgi:hypothetical protein